MISRRSSPERSSTIKCLEMALRETGNGRAISEIVAGLFAIVPRIARLMGSATAEKTRSSLSWE